LDCALYFETPAIYSYQLQRSEVWWVRANILEERTTAILMIKPLVYKPAASIVTATGLVLWHTVETQNREYKRNYLYKLLAIFKVIFNVTYGSLTLPGKVPKTTGNT